ncbi:MAG TPA: hypothetical protein VGQ59_11660 [Cyclobacteriaceae bacterium]|jgi:hypothetical protein|nr:hypothetical protein [Cyclobacteriaceae bacterium]
MRLIFSRWLLVFPVVILVYHTSSAQNLKKVKEFKATKIESVAIDRLGDFFLVFKNGEIKKYDANGKVLASIKRDKIATLLEPWYHPKIFVYDQLDQQITIYDRNFQSPDIRQLEPSIAIKPLLACPTNDNKLLVLDGADFSIKKVNPANNEVIAEFYVDSAEAKPNFVYMRDYQNLIFLLDKNSGIVIYNTVGKKINQLKTDANNFGFFGEELYFLHDDKVVFFDLYTEKIRLVEVGKGKIVLVSDERILLVKENGRVTLFEFNGKDSPD